MPSYAKNDHSTTTGPGQTYEKLRNEWRFLVVTSPQIVQGKEPVLYGAPVMCTQLKQVVTSIDASTALGVTGVVRFISAADLKLIGAANKVEKTHILRHFILKTIILPRQARDKHRKDSKREIFLTDWCLSAVHPRGNADAVCRAVHRAGSRHLAVCGAARSVARRRQIRPGSVRYVEQHWGPSYVDRGSGCGRPSNDYGVSRSCMRPDLQA